MSYRRLGTQLGWGRIMPSPGGAFHSTRLSPSPPPHTYTHAHVHTYKHTLDVRVSYGCIFSVLATCWTGPNDVVFPSTLLAVGLTEAEIPRMVGLTLGAIVGLTGLTVALTVVGIIGEMAGVLCVGGFVAGVLPQRRLLVSTTK